MSEDNLNLDDWYVFRIKGSKDEFCSSGSIRADSVKDAEYIAEGLSASYASQSDQEFESWGVQPLKDFLKNGQQLYEDHKNELI